jgi:hypothetical protein
MVDELWQQKMERRNKVSRIKWELEKLDMEAICYNEKNNDKNVSINISKKCFWYRKAKYESYDSRKKLINIV